MFCSRPLRIRSRTNLVVRRSQYLRGASQGGCGTAWEKAHLVFRAVSRMALACTDRRDAARVSAEPLSGGPHGGRHCCLCGDARLWRPWHSGPAHRAHARTDSCGRLEGRRRVCLTMPQANSKGQERRVFNLDYEGGVAFPFERTSPVPSRPGDDADFCNSFRI